MEMAPPDYASLPPTLDSLRLILQKLRGPDGCPWDRAQTRETLARCLNEECAELIDAIDQAAPAAICDELGDVMMNLVLQILIGEENGEFTLADVFANVNAKMVRRHAHVFGDATAESATDVVELWEKIKAGENRPARTSVLDGVPRNLAALARAEKLQKKAAKVGFDWQRESDIVDKIREELDEFSAAAGDEAAADEELGDLLFAVVNLIRFRQRRTSEELLRQTSGKFTCRFHYIEAQLKAAGIPIETAGLDLLETLWQQAKTHRPAGNAP